MSNPNKPPYGYGGSPKGAMHDPDRTERISTLEIEQRHTNRVLEQHSINLKELGSKVDKLDSTLGRLETQLPFFINELKEVAEGFHDFKQHNINQQLASLRDEQAKKTVALEQNTETNTKVKVIWGICCTVLGIIATVLVKIFTTRFGM